MQADKQLDETLAAVRALRDSIGSGDPIDECEISDLMTEIRSLVPTMPPGDVAMLKSEVDAVIVLVAETKRSIADELKRLQNGRKGLDGYNHIRGYDTQQRLSLTV